MGSSLYNVFQVAFGQEVYGNAAHSNIGKTFLVKIDTLNSRLYSAPKVYSSEHAVTGAADNGTPPTYYCELGGSDLTLKSATVTIYIVGTLSLLAWTNWQLSL